MSRAAPIALALLAGCSPDLVVPEGAQVTCTSTADCPSDLVCNSGRCVAPEQIGTPPDLAGLPAVTPQVGREGTLFAIDLEATKPLVEPPQVTLGLVPPVDVPCTSTGGERYRCSYQATGLENGGQGGVVGFDVTLVDRALTRTVRNLVGALAFDFAPPAPRLASAVYLPAPSNPLPTVSRATSGTTVRVALAADEPLDPLDPPELVARSGASVLPLPLLPGSLDLNAASFEITVPPGTPDGDYALSVTWSDLAGNGTTAAIEGTELRIKTSAPALTVDQAGVTYVRSPWGNASTEPRGAFTFPAGPYFALAPADPLASTPTLPAQTFSAAGGGLVVVRVWADEARSALLGTFRPEAGGEWPRARLQNVDVLAVWVTGLDEAGNESAPVRITRSEWVATPNAPAFGPNPHVLAMTRYASATRAQEEARFAAASEAAGTDASAVRSVSGSVWRDRTYSSLPVPARSQHALAHDAARGRTVLFGGTAESDTWEWDGDNWRRISTVGPAPRYGAAMAYDSARGRVVLFGGATGAAVLDDTWEWDGTRWTPLQVSGPAARSGHAMVNDAARGRVVLFGGMLEDGSFAGDTWEWDGEAWTRVSTTGPAARTQHAMAHDPARGRTVLHGGQGEAETFADTWEWNGSAWSLVATTGPVARYASAMAHDGTAVVLFGGWIGFDALADTWEWDGSVWNSSPGAAPPSTQMHAMAGDGRRVLLFGGQERPFDSTRSDTWVRDGSGWAQVGRLGPRGNVEYELAYDAQRARSVLVGAPAGQIETHEWNGAGWTLAASGSPPARHSSGLAYDAARNRTILFGGATLAFPSTSLADTWSWDGASWTPVATTGPLGRYDAAMAYDAARQRVVLLGGYTDGIPLVRTDTWEWNGTAWALALASGPEPDIDIAMSGGPGGQVVVAGRDANTWRWNGTAWTSVAPSGPGVVVGASMAYDSVRTRAVLAEGTRTWEWDGAGWTQLASSEGPAGWEPAMAFDASRGRTVLVDSYSADPARTWELDAAPAHRPAVQLDVVIGPSGIDPSTVTDLRVRAFAGGTHAGGTASGAALHGWAVRGTPGAWEELGTNAVGLAAAAPWLPAAPTSLVEWSAGSPAEARRFIVERDGLAFQVRSAGGAGADSAGAAVALDYLEVRIRYELP